MTALVVATTNQGKLREPILFVLSFLRGLGAQVAIDHPLNSYTTEMGEKTACMSRLV